MKQFWQILIKSFLAVTGLALIILLVAGLVLILDWPWWTGFFFLLLLFGAAIGVILVRKMLRRRREQQFVEQIISQDDLKLKAMAAQERDEAQLLQTRWKEAIDTLKRSHLRKFGNPLYVLPWYLVIGESGSGKTTAIKSARLSSPFAEASQVSGISGTRNCDWWFFEQAVILDTAGRYAIPVHESRDKEEWHSFLNLLARFRKKEPLNGLIVTVSASKLLEASQEELEREGLQIRSRIDEIMLAIGSKFPVYVMVTKCDLIKGMTHFCDKLPEKVVDQAMGVVNPQHLKVTPAFWANAVDTVSERVGNLLLRVLHDTRSRKVDPALILFPSEFERLRNGLHSFMARAFQENPYQETPILRGLFFTSGRQEGTPYSHFLQKLGLLGEKEVLPGTSKGLFLHDFFARILPMDRGIFAPTRRSLEWQRLSRNLGLTSWVTLLIALCGLMSFSFVKNLQTMREVPKEFLQQSGPLMQGDLLMDVVNLDQYKEAIVRIEERNRNWWMPRFGLTHSIEVERQLKQKFSEQFKKTFLMPLDKRMADRMAGFNVATPDQLLNRHISHLVRRINLLKKRLETNELETLAGMPRVPFLILLTQEQKELIPEVRKKLGSIYLHYLHWNQDDSQINLEMTELQNWLKHALAAKGGRLDWLIPWANEQEELAWVTLADFWGGSRNLHEDVRVAPAFSRKGKEMIDVFLQEIEAALPEPGPSLIARQKLEFAERYRQGYLEEWRAFAAGFNQGAKRLAGFEEWLPMAQKITSLAGPYFALLDKMAEECPAVAGEGKAAPAWVALTADYRNLRAQAEVLGRSEGGGLLAKAGEKSKSLIDKVGQKLDSEGRVENFENQLQAAKALKEYQNSLQEAMPTLSPRKAAYDNAAAVFRDEKNPIATARQAVARMKTYMTAGKKDEEVFWSLINGSVDFLWDFERTEAACYLQDRWEKDVLVEVQGVSDQQKVMQLLLDEDGFALKFVKGPAAPFVSRNPAKGYYAERALEGQLAFEPAFFTFLTKGVSAKRTVQASYDVAIKGLPTDANQDALLKPHATHVELQCAGGSVKLDNFQFPEQKTFKWSPETCGDVIFEIEVSHLVLTKIYKGSRAFVSFLADFKTGQKSFYPADFPEQKEELDRLGIKYIKVNYQFTGHGPILQLQQAAPGQVPQRVVQCWD
ncbi:MAG: type VI secretion protein IcmF/TssM N-terminal domain-containing protein [Thermodesulfobacteriota bacterium]